MKDERICKFVFNAFQDYSKSEKPEVTVRVLSSYHQIQSHIVSLLKPSKYLPSEIVKLEQSSTVYEVRFTCNETDVILYMIKVNNTSPPLKKIIKLIRTFVFILNKLKQLPKVEIVIMPFDVPKMLPCRFEPLSSKHINTGVMFRTISGSYIAIYRLEELSKVLLHELMHYYSMDFNDGELDTYAVEHLASKNIIVKTDRLGLHEIYNDTMTILFLIGLKIMIEERPENYASYKQQYDASLANVMKFMVANAAKVLQYYGKETLDDGKPITEGSHVFTYYIGKAITFTSLDQFMETVPKELIIDHRKDKSKLFTDYFLSAVTAASVRGMFNDAIIRLKRIDDEFFKKTIRMSNLDL